MITKNWHKHTPKIWTRCKKNTARYFNSRNRKIHVTEKKWSRYSTLIPYYAN